MRLEIPACVACAAGGDDHTCKRRNVEEPRDSAKAIVEWIVDLYYRGVLHHGAVSRECTGEIHGKVNGLAEAYGVERPWRAKGKA